MSANTDLLYSRVKDSGYSALAVRGLTGGDMDIIAADLLAAMVPVSIPVPASGWEGVLKICSQWADDANSRQADCGWACLAMFLRALGDMTPINNLKSNNPEGWSDAPELQAMLKTHGVESSIVHDSPNLPMSAVAPYTMLLIKYGPIARYSQDKGYSGLHWLIYVGPDPNNANNSLVMDPDYWSPLNGGDHKSLPTSALRTAYCATADGGLTTGIVVPFKPISLPPAPTSETMTVNTGTLNVRPEPGTAKAAIRTVVRGQVLVVRGSTLANSYHWAELLSVDGIPQTGYVAREYLAPAPVPPAPESPPVTVIPKAAVHFQTNGDKVGLLDLLKTGKIGGVLNMRVNRDNDLTASEVKAVAPAVEVCERFWFDDKTSPSGRNFTPDWSQRDLQQVGYDWCKEYFDTFPTDRKSNWHQIINEPSWGPGTASFWQGAMDYADAIHVNLGLLCISNGNPPLPYETQRNDYREFWIDPDILAMLRRGKKRGDVMLLHEYVLPQEQGLPWTDDWCILRHKRVHDVLPDDLKDMYIIVGEWGDTHGTAYGNQHYADNLKQGLALVKDDAYLRWLAWWTWGATNEQQWGKDKIEGAKIEIMGVL